MSQELKRLAKISADSRYAQGANGWTTAYSFEVMKRFIAPGPVLEMGPAEGVMTDLLMGLGQPLTVVEGSEIFCHSISKRHPSAKVVHSLFEDYEPAQKFQTIVLGHVLEHINDPVGLLARAKSWLTDSGRIVSAVPNSRSLHRQIGVLMGMLKFEEDLNEADLHHGHRRVYNPESFRADFTKAGFGIEYFGGYFMKPLSNSQIEKTWTPEMVEAFMKLGERYPDIAAELVVVARPK